MEVEVEEEVEVEVEVEVDVEVEVEAEAAVVCEQSNSRLWVLPHRTSCSQGERAFEYLLVYL